MPHRTDILVVGEIPCHAAGSLLDRDGFGGRARPPATALAAFDESLPDCLVVCGESLPAALAARASEAGCPIVDCACASVATRNGRETDGPADLADRVRAAVDGTPNRERIARLHAGSAELIGVEDRDRLYERVVGIGSEVLGFDIAVLYLRDDDGFRLGASTAPNSPPSLDEDHGLVAHTFETGEPTLVDDIAAHPITEQRIHEHRSGLAVPFGDVGVFVGLSTALSSYDAVDLELAELLANHAAQVDARLRAEADLRERQIRITRLHEAAPSIIDAESEAVLFGRIVDIAEGVLELDQSVLVMASDGQLRPVAGRTDELAAIAPNAGILGRTYGEGRSFLVDDAHANPDAAPAAETIRSAISVPVGDRGVFQAFSEETGSFDRADLELAELLVGYVEATLERMHSEAALRESRRVIERLHATATDVAAAETEAALLDRAITGAEEVLDLCTCKIDLREGELLVPAAKSTGTPPDASRTVHLSEGIAGKTARTGESFRIDDVESDPDAAPTRPEFHSAISVPVGDLGVFQAVSPERAAFDQEDVDLVELLMAHVAVSLRRVRAEADLRAQRDSFEALFENIPGAAVAYEMIDGEPIVRRVNGAFEQTFGYDADAVVGESIDEYTVPRDAPAAAEEYNSRLARGERVQAEVERLTAEGPKHFLLQVIPDEVGRENVPGYAIYSDVTEQREREAELRRQNERLEQFASVVSHDLRNPLNVASGYLDVARERGELGPLDRVEAALDRMDELVTDLLTLAREGRDVGETQSVAIDAVAREAWDNVATDGASLRIETEQAVAADPDRLVELFENLYRNSIEHGPTGDRPGSGPSVERAGDAPTVTVGPLADRAGFYVADDGRGIDPDIDPFDTGVTTSEEGTGFGLPIVRGIAEAHGWSVSVTEGAAGGARFEFETR